MRLLHVEINPLATQDPSIRIYLVTSAVELPHGRALLSSRHGGASQDRGAGGCEMQPSEATGREAEGTCPLSPHLYLRPWRQARG